MPPQKPRRLGEILLERGWVTHEQLFRALEKQQHAAGRLGTALLEIEALSEELLLQALSEQQRVPLAGIDELRSIPPEILDLVPARIAVRCRAIPFRVAGSQVHVAMMDVKNLAFQDELAFVTAKRIKVYICHEARIFEALEKFYDHQCATRYAQLLDRLNRARYLWDRGVEVPISGGSGESSIFVSAEKALGAPGTSTRETVVAPEKPPAPVPPPEEPRFDTRITAPGDLPMAPAPPAFNLAPEAFEDITLIVPPPAAPSAPVAPAASSPPPATAPAATRLEAPPPAAPTAAPAAAPSPATAPAAAPAAKPAAEPGLSPVEFEARLLSPKDRNDVGATLLRYLSQSFSRVALFMAHKDQVAGWMGHGVGLNEKALMEFQTDFAQPSVFLNLRPNGDYFLGPLPPMPVHRDLARTWGGEMPRESLVLPIRLKGRLVAFIYADRGSTGLPGLEMEDLLRIAAKASIAFELCIMRNKLRNA